MRHGLAALAGVVAIDGILGLDLKTGQASSESANWFAAHKPGLIEWALKRSAETREDFFTLTFSNSGYVGAVVNQMVAMSRFDPTMPAKLNVFCLDKELEDLLEEMGAPPCYAKMHDWQESYGGLWALRVAVLEVLVVRARLNVLLTDSDAIWQHDPRPDLVVRTDFDILASQGKYPGEFAHKWRTGSMCMGFIVFKNTNPNKHFLAELAKLGRRSKENFDDQFAANQILNSTNVRWKRVSEDREYVGRGKVNAGFGQMMVINVALLPRLNYTRDHCEAAHPDAFIVHCVAPKKSEAKIQNMKAMGTHYVCCDDYLDRLRHPPANLVDDLIPTDAPYAAFLASIQALRSDRASRP